MLFIMGCIIALFIAEFALRIYNPFPLPHKNSVFLRNNFTISIQNTKGLKDIDKNILVSKNRCGFRGPDLEDKFKTKILFIGGSTTECLCVSDNKDWPSLIGNRLRKIDKTIWTNNAGMGGNSVFGHLILMDYVVKKVHPDYICFMVGINDAQVNKLTIADKGMAEYFEKKWKAYLLQNSRLIQTFKFFHGVKEAYGLGLPDESVDFDSIEYISDENDSVIRNNIRVFNKIVNDIDTSYVHRIQRLIEICNRNDIKPIFIAQTTAYGFKDSVSGKDLNQLIKVKLSASTVNIHGKYSNELNIYYNNLTKNVCFQNNVEFINLDSLMPKSSAYFYDFIHFNNGGCKKVSEIIFPEIVQILEKDSRIKLPIIRE